MDWAGRNDRTLGRIAAVLLSLAVLAERAGGRCFPVRWLVLSILWRAEAVVRAFVAGEMGTDEACFDDPSRFTASPLDAAWLALRFRTLAAVLHALSRLESGGGGWNPGGDHPPRRPAPRARLRLATPGGGAPVPFDTS